MGGRKSAFKVTSWKQVQAHAAAVVLDGHPAPGTHALAALGSHGRHAQNLERDGLRHFQRISTTCLRPYACSVPYYEAGSENIEYLDTFIVLPHEVFDTLLEEAPDRFVGYFGNEESRRAWWQSCREPWLDEHPLHSLLKSSKSSGFAPLALHGDDIAMRRGLTPVNSMVMSLSSPLSCDRFDAILLLACVPLKRIVPGPDGSLEHIYRALQWSFAALARGVYPCTDHTGAEFTSPHRRQKADTPIGCRGVLVDFLGDWKFNKEALRLQQHYNKAWVCHECWASKRPGPMNFANVQAGAFEARPTRSHQDYIAHFDRAGERRPALAEIFGFHLGMVRVDFEHCDHLGVAQWLVAESMLLLCEIESAPGGKKEDRFNRLLRSLHEDFKDWCGGAQVSSSQPVFTYLKLVSDDFPGFKGKAHNTYLVGRWLCEEKADIIGARVPLLALCLKSWLSCQTVLKGAGEVLTGQEADMLLNSAEAFLKAWTLLSIRACEAKQKRFCLKPKHHAWHHGVRRAHKSLRNPRTHWLYRHEGFAGQIGRLALRCHVTTASRRVIERWLLRWRGDEVRHMPGARARKRNRPGRFARRVRARV